MIKSRFIIILSLAFVVTLLGCNPGQSLFSDNYSSLPRGDRCSSDKNLWDFVDHKVVLEGTFNLIEDYFKIEEYELKNLSWGSDQIDCLYLGAASFDEVTTGTSLEK